MIEGVTFVEDIGSNSYVAPEGKVITNYKEGDEQIMYSSTLIFVKSSEPTGFYLMDIAEAERIEAELDVIRRAKYPEIIEDLPEDVSTDIEEN